jgi:uncharacterized protein (DUF362 family)
MKRDKLAPSVVSLIRGDDRYDNVRRALDAIADTVDFSRARRLLVKPNLVSATNQLASTHVDAIRALLDFLRQRDAGHIVIAENTAEGATKDAYREFGYERLFDEYDIELVDLANEEWVESTIYDDEMNLVPVRLARRIVESDYRISVNPIKTHNCVMVTLGIKNLAIGALKERSTFHQGYPAMNLSLLRLAQMTAPHLSVLDGFVGMQGDGPCSGEPVDLRVAIAGVDPVAADTIGALVMGHDPRQVGYLLHCAREGLGNTDLQAIDLRGNVSIAGARREFCRHPDYEKQLGWCAPYDRTE